ncbi:MAG: hypothetical protein K0U12_02060 [Gammaproteobacteria bacterium]|nr:hypothetical protein [Gammaproteobacteria bacterium]
MSLRRRHRWFLLLIFCSTIFQLFYSYFIYGADKVTSDTLTSSENNGGVVTACALLAVFDMLESFFLVNPAETAYDLAHKKNDLELEQLNEDEDEDEDLDDGEAQDREQGAKNYQLLSRQAERSDVDPQARTAVATRVVEEKLHPTSTCAQVSNFIINYPLRGITYISTFSGFILKALTDAIALGSWIKYSPVKFFFGALSLGFGTTYLTMLLHGDVVEHHNYIYSYLFSTRKSILINIIKSPLIFLELLVTNVLTALLYSFLFSFAIIQSKDTYFPEYKDNDSLNTKLAIIASYAMTYTTFFTRYLSSQGVYFNTELSGYDKTNDSKLNYKASWVFNFILRIARSAGVVYFVSKYLGSGSAGVIAALALLSTVLLVHAAYISYKRCLNTARLSFVAQQVEAGSADVPPSSEKCIRALCSIINGGSKVAFSLAVFASFQEVQHYLGLQFSTLDLGMLTLCFAIPSSINDFDYYNSKILEALTYYQYKYGLESKHRTFGKLCCIFRSTKQYPTNTQMLAVEERDHEIDDLAL